MRPNYVPAPYSIYKGIQKLQPGALLSFSLERAAKQRSYEIEQYWSAKAAAETGAAAMFDGSSADAIAALDERLREAVGLRMEADVPLGAFLSGGIDSSTVVALMQAQSARPVRTFSIGFLEDSYNEAQYAKAVARHLGTEHTELYVTPEETMAAIPKMPTLYDEPFADSSQIPTFLVSKLARQHVVVTLSGDGGDELFAGYNRYFWGRGLWRKVGWMPKSVRRGIGRALVRRPPQNWDRLFDTLGRFVPRALRQPNPGDKLHKVAEVLGVESPDEMYHWLVSHWKHPAELVKGGDEPPTALTDKSQWANLTDFIQRMMFLDQVSYLPDDVLAKVDRASMGVSLESRVPLLDHHLVEFAWHLPVSMKIRHGQGKWLLRQVLYRHVPKELVERPKMGFGVPIDHWLRGPLRDWAESLLDERRLEREGFFRPQPIREKWHEHLSGRRNWQYYLWDVLMFQAWFERWEQRAG
jgi:asparagine synthase (glutamine-hydrolysing)